MVQLLFVHGVATRTTAKYDIECANRDLLFRTALFKDKPLDIYAPRWGDFVPEIPSVIFERPSGVVAYSGIGEDSNSAGTLGVGTDDVASSRVAELAQRDGTAALDAILTTLVEMREDEGELLTDEDIAMFARATDHDETSSPFPDMQSDGDLAGHLESEGDASYGIDIGGAISSAIAAVGDRLQNAASGAVFDAARGYISPAVGRFLGDVFVYLNPGALRDEIRECIREKLLEAWAVAQQKNEPLVIIGHSLGGVILYDMLSSPASVNLPSDLKVAALLTVGSQPGLFQSLNLFDVKHTPNTKNPAPECVQAWLNIFDPIDPFGFCAVPMFEKVEDFVFDSVTGVISAHTTYFKRPQFHAKSRARLSALGII